MALRLLNWYLHLIISSVQLIIKNIRFNPALWKSVHYGTAVKYAILYYLQKQIIWIPMAQKQNSRRWKSVSMHNFSTSPYSMPCINEATKTLISLRWHISLRSASRDFYFSFLFLKKGLIYWILSHSGHYFYSPNKQRTLKLNQSFSS